MLPARNLDSCVFLRKQLLYDCHQKKIKQNPNSMKYLDVILNFNIWTINFSGSSQYCLLFCLNDGTVLQALDTDSTNRTGL